MSSIEDPEELCMSRNCFAGRQTDRQTGRQADMQTDRQTDRPNRVNSEARPGQKSGRDRSDRKLRS